VTDSLSLEENHAEFFACNFFRDVLIILFCLQTIYMAFIFAFCAVVTASTWPMLPETSILGMMARFETLRYRLHLSHSSSRAGYVSEYTLNNGRPSEILQALIDRSPSPSPSDLATMQNLLTSVANRHRETYNAALISSSLGLLQLTSGGCSSLAGSSDLTGVLSAGYETLLRELPNAKVELVRNIIYSTFY
jgi:hypothetical protein